MYEREVLRLVWGLWFSRDGTADGSDMKIAGPTVTPQQASRSPRSFRYTFRLVNLLSQISHCLKGDG